MYNQLLAYIYIHSNSSSLSLGQNIRATTKNLQRNQSFYKIKILHQKKGTEDGKRPGGEFLCTSTAWGSKTTKRVSGPKTKFRKIAYEHINPTVKTVMQN